MEGSLERMKCVAVAHQNSSATTPTLWTLGCLVGRSLVVESVAVFVGVVPHAVFSFLPEQVGAAVC